VHLDFPPLVFSASKGCHAVDMCVDRVSAPGPLEFLRHSSYLLCTKLVLPAEESTPPLSRSYLLKTCRVTAFLDLRCKGALGAGPSSFSLVLLFIRFFAFRLFHCSLLRFPTPPSPFSSFMTFSPRPRLVTCPPVPRPSPDGFFLSSSTVGHCSLPVF